VILFGLLIYKTTGHLSLSGFVRQIIAIGKNAQFLRDAEREYLARIRHFTKIEILELKEDKSKNPKEIMKKEGKKIKNALKGRQYIVLDIGAPALSTMAFTNMLKETSDIVFGIGGPNGLDEEIIKGAQKRISLSRMTFTHQIARILLLEQIYRAYSIINNMKYHK